MKTRDLILIALISANVTLAAVGMALYVGRSEPAAVAATSSRAGDYVMVSGSISNSREALMIIDVVAKKAALFVPDAGATAAGTKWKMTDLRDLAVDFGGPAATAGGTGKRPGYK